MKPEERLKRWRQALPSDISWGEVEKLALHFGFTIRRATHGYVLKHEQMVTHPGALPHVMISDHQSGGQRVELNSVRQLLKAIEEIQEQQRK